MKSAGHSGVLLGLFLASALATDGTAGGAGEAKALDCELLKKAPTVLKYLREHDCRNVAVLKFRKFRVEKGGDPISDSVGTLNLNVARRLEIALVLAIPFKDPVGVVRDASSVAATIPGGNHLNRSGRRALFTKSYPLAWGNEKVVPDVFLTGDITVSPDLRTSTVKIYAFDKHGETLDPVTQFDATLDAPVIAEAGESYVLSRGLFDAGKVELNEAVVGLAARVKAEERPNPVRDESAPVRLSIFYGDRQVEPEVEGGKARLPEPREGEKVSFVLSKADQTPDRYAAVFTVNGQSTLFKERCSPVEARKWILAPGTPPIVIDGFQVDEGRSEAFRVLSNAESSRDAMNYGPEAGTISLVIFREQKGRGEAIAASDEAEDVAAIAKLTFPERTPENLAALKHQIRIVSGGGSRGLIVPGGERAFAIRWEEFLAHPTPVMTTTITYYKPQAAGGK